MNIFKKNILFIHLAVLVIEVLCETNVEVKLNNGIVLGKIETTIFKKINYHAFKGIPYATPPIGELRFQPPIPHPGWTEPLETFDNKPTCVQFSARMRMNEAFGVSGSEDCLFINVFSPNLEGKAPVIIFDYNDSFNSGFNGTDTYSPENFMEDDVVLVTISHRLGMFGYLTTEDEVIPPNNGLRDFILGLEWVKENVKSFGGDPDRVTIMGSLSGGALANMLLYSPKAKGLFSNVIIQSGNVFDTTYFYDNPSPKSFELGEQIGVKTNDSRVLLEELQKVDAWELLDKMIAVYAKDMHYVDLQRSTQLFAPVVEGDSANAVLKSLPENGEIVNDVPVIIGMNSQEGLDFIAQVLMHPQFLTKSKETNILKFPKRVNYRFDRESENFKCANQELRKMYNLNVNLLDTYYFYNYSTFAGDLMQGYSLNYAAKELSTKLSSPVYYYLFEFRGQLNENSQYLTRQSRITLDHKGATVCDELCYLLVCSRIKKDYIDLSKKFSEQNERKVMKRMVRMWTNFAKTGNPTPIKDSMLKNFIWQPISKNSNELEFLRIARTLSMDTDPLGERGRFWDEFLKKYEDIAVDGVVSGGEPCVIEEDEPEDTTAEDNWADMMSQLKRERDSESTVQIVNNNNNNDTDTQIEDEVLAESDQDETRDEL